MLSDAFLGLNPNLLWNKCCLLGLQLTNDMQVVLVLRNKILQKIFANLAMRCAKVKCPFSTSPTGKPTLYRMNCGASTLEVLFFFRCCTKSKNRVNPSP